MMKQYVVDAFTDKVFGGNPAAVCILGGWIDEPLMMSITVENNLSETAFAVKEGDKYHLRCGLRRVEKSTCAAMPRWPAPAC